MNIQRNQSEYNTLTSMTSHTRNCIFGTPESGFGYVPWLISLVEWLTNIKQTYTSKNEICLTLYICLLKWFLCLYRSVSVCVCVCVCVCPCVHPCMWAWAYVCAVMKVFETGPEWNLALKVCHFKSWLLSDLLKLAFCGSKVGNSRLLKVSSGFWARDCFYHWCVKWREWS